MLATAGPRAAATIARRNLIKNPGIPVDIGPIVSYLISVRRTSRRSFNGVSTMQMFIRKLPKQSTTAQKRFERDNLPVRPLRSFARESTGYLRGILRQWEREAKHAGRIRAEYIESLYLAPIRAELANRE